MMKVWVNFVMLALAVSAAAPSKGSADSELAGTSWRLVNITSMNDQVFVPDDHSKYTLTLRADGRVTIKADCNRATGAWMSSSPGQLQFGVLAATKALCQPDSLSEKYLAQFQWIRSYVMENGHLFLATMADGSIIEFEPANTGLPVATVLGEPVPMSDYEEVRQYLLSKLFNRYAAAHGIMVQPEEVDSYVESIRRGMAEKGLTAEQDLTPEKAAQAAAMRRDMGRALIRQWKINKALYEQYGGRIIYQQLGPEPLDAYRQFLEQREAEGAFEIRDQALADKFWHYFKDDTIHDFMAPGSDDEARAFRSLPWETGQ